MHNYRYRPKTKAGLRGRQRGAALIVVLLLAVVSLGAALFISRNAQTELRVAYNYQSSLQALASAEAGMSHAYRLLSTGSGSFDPVLNGGGVTGGTAGVMATLGAGGDVNLDSAGTFYRFGGQFPSPPGSRANDGYYVRVVDNFDETPNNAAVDADKRVKIVSRGRKDSAERTIEALVEKSPGACLFGITDVTMSGGATRVNSYNPTTFAISSNAVVGSNADISLSGGSTIQGDANAGGTVNDPADVTGTSTNGASPQSFSPVAGCSPYSSGAGLSGTYTYNSVTGDLDVGGGNNVTLAAGSYCFNDVVLSGGSTITVTSGPVVIYLTGKGTFSGGSFANTTHVASNLQILSSATNISNQKVTISGGSETYMTVYAPNVPIVISGGSDFFGSAVGYDVTLSGGTLFHCNEETTGGAFKLLSWRELRNP